MKELVSIAIETSCRYGGVALGLGQELAEVIDFNASSRHTTSLIVRLQELLERRDLKATDIDEIYVAVGPGSFTGIRVGVTVARTLAQSLPHAKAVAVPSTHAVAQNLANLDWQHLAVVLDAKDELVYAQLVERQQGQIVPSAQPAVMPLRQFVAQSPKPLLLAGEGLLYQKPDVLAELAATQGLTLAENTLYYPNAKAVWTVGRALAFLGQFTDYHQLLPIYARRSEAERLWDIRQGTKA